VPIVKSGEVYCAFCLHDMRDLSGLTMEELEERYSQQKIIVVMNGISVCQIHEGYAQGGDFQRRLSLMKEQHGEPSKIKLPEGHPRRKL
jgi:hypothetical protein